MACVLNYGSIMMNRYSIGQNLTIEQVNELTGGKVAPGWYQSKAGQKVYICDGCHRDGFYGYKVLDLGGLK